MRRLSNSNVDWSSYEPVNKVQEEFHESKAKHKLLLGGYRAGKTYPAIHEALFTCFDNPGHEYAIFRNTWDSLEENIQKDFLEVAANYNAYNPKDWDSQKHNLVLRCGTTIKFRPLSMGRKQLKGLSICGFLVDDPEVNRYKDVISFLFTRLTNAAGRPDAKYFSSIICANYEGHDWLWKTYCRRREQGGDGLFAYWFCKTTDNPTLQADYIEVQSAIHSKAWMDRYIYMKQDSYSGLVYDEYNPKKHDADLGWCFKDHSLYKIRVIDLGITHPTVVLDIATDFKKIYFYNEWYKTGIRTADLGDYLINSSHKETFNKILIDPKSNAKDQTSGVSPRNILRKDFGIVTTFANNSEKYGIEILKGLLTERNSEIYVYVDPIRCPNLVRELETLSWQAPEMADFDELGYVEKVKDIDNDCTDCARYGVVFLKPKLKLYRNADDVLKLRREQQWEDRINKLKLYKESPELFEMHKNDKIKKLIELHNKGLTS